MNKTKLTLNNGINIPQIGLGTWLNDNEEDCINSIKYALGCGYRHIDTAQIYSNEIFVGKAIKESGVNRKDVFITTKVWNENLWWDGFDKSFDESLNNLQTDYVDLLLIHFPVTEERRPAWFKMEEKYTQGKAKAIGVSNYTVRHLEELLAECKVKPAVNQVELHVFLQQPDLVKYCQKNNIILEAYSPLAHGYKIDDPVLTKISNQHKKTNAQIMLRWCLDMGFVVLPKSTNPKRIKENLEILDFSLTPTNMEEIEKLDCSFRTCWDPTHTP